MATLELRVLGDLEVIRGDDVLELPPSRKTRGLLAYLALTDRPSRREQLCELLWEIPDDPRGSLRWSLSKIRKLVDDEGCPRIIANRSTVAFDTSAVDIDVMSLHSTSANIESASEEELLHAARRYQGTFLDGLDLDNFHDFQAWCIGERQRAVRSQARVLQELVKRLADQPERAVQHAIALVSLTPVQESSRAQLIRLLIDLDRQAEARHHFRIGREKLAEAGVQETGALGRALREIRRPARPPDAIPAVIPQQASLVGREAEIARLGEHINQLASSASARLVLISGEPGIGKSCLLLVAAAMARTAGARIFKASAFESEILRPFGVWSDALRRAMPEGTPAHRFLASDEQMTREQVFSSLADIFREETGKGSVVVLCDDVHWADESSWSAVHYLLRNHPRQPLLFVAASRDREIKENASAQAIFRGLRAEGLLDEIQLAPLSPVQIEHLIRGTFPNVDASALAGECSGNPLLALELARAGVEGKRSLAELVRERLSCLDPDAESVLHWAAVLAPRINIHSLQNASGLEREVIDEALVKAEQQGILHPGERGLRFSHELIRGSVYELIPPARRRAMHRHAAELLAEEASIDLALAADLAHHAQLSGDSFTACRAAVSAGKMCIRFYANEQAMALYRQGMAAAAQLGDAQRVCLSLELAEVRFNAQPIEHWQEEVEHFVQLAEQAMDHGSPSHARLGYQLASYLRWAHGEAQGAKRFSLQAERVARGATDNAQILGMAEAAKCLALLERDLSQADAMAMEAQALARRHGYNCPAISLGLGILRYYGHQFDGAVEYLEDARAQSKSDGDRLSEFLANEYLAIVEMERGDCATAYQHACNLVAMADRMREGSERPFSHALQAVCRYAITGEKCALEPTLRDLRAADAKQRLAYLLNRAAIHHLACAELQQAYEYAGEALQLAQVMERPSELLQAYINLEHVHRRDSDIAPDSVCEHIERLAATGVAGWVKERAHSLMHG